MKKFFLKILYFILKVLAKTVLFLRKPEIVAITGSVAKSSTKEAIYSILKQRFAKKVAESAGNLNNEIGLPLAVLGFKKSPTLLSWPFVLIWAFLKTIFYCLFFIPYPKILVLEMAADKPGDIEYLVKIAPPKVAVVTAVGPSHLQAFGTVEKVAQEKTKLVEVLPESGYAVLNEKDFRVFQMAKNTKASVRYFSPNNLDIPIQAATLVGQLFGLKLKEEIEEGLKNYRPLKGRINLLRGISGSLIIDDSYNANPLSMKYALKQLIAISKQRSGKRKIAVLGDMLELGDYTEEGHKEVGRMAKQNCDLILTTGQKAQLIAKEGGGLYFQTKKQLIEFLKREIREGDIILVKASRGMKFEEIVEKVKS